jgi:hypothetical protein
MIRGDTKMKKNAFPVSLLLLFVLFVFSQEIVENPEKSLNPNAGRILKLEEVLRITDEGGGFYFKRPTLLQIAEDGCIFLYDSEQFLKFSPSGVFMKNLFTKGQGPGEIQRFTRYALRDKDIFIYDSGNSKILYMNQEGEMMEEFRLTERYSLLLGLFGDHFVFTTMKFPETEEITGNFIDIPTSILILSKQEEVIKEYPSVTEKAYTSENFMMSWGRSFTIMSEDGKLCIWSDPEEYMITELDIGSGEIVRKFKRKYPRVKPPKRKPPPGRPFKIPERKFMSDIDYIYSFQGNVLVWTSTKDEKKGMFFDLFDMEGKYIDSFWVNVSGTVIATYKDFFYVREQDEEGNISIVKYLVVG